MHHLPRRETVGTNPSPSKVFGVPSTFDTNNSIVACRKSNQENLASAKRRLDLRNAKDADYADCVLEMICDRSSQLGYVCPTRNYVTIIQSLCDLPRDNSQKRAESKIASASIGRIYCAGASDCRRDAAAALTLAEAMDKQPLEISEKDIALSLLNHLDMMQVPCCAISEAKDMKGLIHAVDVSQNRTNINIALAEMGISPKSLNKDQSKVVEKLLESAKTQKAIGTPADFKASLISNGFVPNVGNIMFMAYAASSMGSVWPVPPPWGPFEFGFSGTSDPQEEYMTGSKTGDAMIVALTTGLVNLGVNYTQSQIQQAQKESELRLAQKYKELYGTTPSTQQMAQFANSNPNYAAEAFSAGMQSAGIKQSDVDAAVKAAMEEGKKDNTLMYVGIGAGALTLVVVAALLSRR